VHRHHWQKSDHAQKPPGEVAFQEVQSGRGWQPGLTTPPRGRGKGEWGSAIECLYYGNKLQFEGYGRVSGGVKHEALVLGLLECASASRVIQRSTYLGDMVTLQKRAGMASMPPNGMGKDPMFKLNGELLHGGQGKDNKLINIDCNHNQPGGLNVQLCTTNGLEGLDPPWLEETGEVVLGDNKMQKRKENKCHWR
jgi:hypothetical protein